MADRSEGSLEVDADSLDIDAVFSSRSLPPLRDMSRSEVLLDSFGVMGGAVTGAAVTTCVGAGILLAGTSPFSVMDSRLFFEVLRFSGEVVASLSSGGLRFGSSGSLGGANPIAASGLNLSLEADRRGIFDGVIGGYFSLFFSSTTSAGGSGVLALGSGAGVGGLDERFRDSRSGVGVAGLGVLPLGSGVRARVSVSGWGVRDLGTGSVGSTGAGVSAGSSRPLAALSSPGLRSASAAAAAAAAFEFLRDFFLLLGVASADVEGARSEVVRTLGGRIVGGGDAESGGDTGRGMEAGGGVPARGGGEVTLAGGGDLAVAGGDWAVAGGG